MTTSTAAKADAFVHNPPSDLTPTLVFAPGKRGATPQPEARPKLPKMGKLESVEVTWLWPGKATTDTLSKDTLARLGQWSDLLRYLEASTVVNGVGCRVLFRQERGASQFVYTEADGWQRQYLPSWGRRV